MAGWVRSIGKSGFKIWSLGFGFLIKRNTNTSVLRHLRPQKKRSLVKKVTNVPGRTCNWYHMSPRHHFSPEDCSRAPGLRNSQCKAQNEVKVFLREFLKGPVLAQYYFLLYSSRILYSLLPLLYAASYLMLFDFTFHLCMRTLMTPSCIYHFVLIVLPISPLPLLQWNTASATLLDAW